MDCTLLGYDVTLFNEKRMDCVEVAFADKKTPDDRRLALCDKMSKIVIHRKFAECYYGASSEEATEEKENEKNEELEEVDVDMEGMMNVTVTTANSECFILVNATKQVPIYTAENAIVLDMHKDFDGFFVELVSFWTFGHLYVE